MALGLKRKAPAAAPGGAPLRRKKRRRSLGGAPSPAAAPAAPPAANGSPVPNRRLFHGIYAAVISPLKLDLSINLGAVEPYARMLAGDGVNGVFVGGTAGASMSMSVAERKQLLAEWTRVAPKHNLEVLAHVGAQSLADTCELARHAEECGAAAVSAMAPCFFKPGTVGALGDFIERVAAAAPRTPFLYYHFPEITGVNFPMALVFQELHPRVPTLRGAKFTSTNMWDLGDTIDYGKSVGRDWDLLQGYEGQTTSVMPLGVTAHIGIAFGIIGPVWVRMIRAFEAGNHAQAAEEQRLGREWFKMFADISGLWSMGAATKAMLSWRLNLELGDMRPPQKNLNLEQVERLRVAWADMQKRYPGLLKHDGPLKMSAGKAPAPAPAPADPLPEDFCQLPGALGHLRKRVRRHALQIAEAVGMTKGDMIRAIPHISKTATYEHVPVDVDSVNLADYIDHTLLKADATAEEVAKLCAEARKHGFKAVCVNSSRVAQCAEALRGSRVGLAAVVGFPLGAATTKTKAQEVTCAVRDGAGEIDMVLNVGKLKDGDYGAVLADVKGVCQAAKADPSRPAIVKVILETCLLSDDEIIDASIICAAAGAEFVKTSTGFSKHGATPHAVDLMKAVVGTSFQVKASGGVRDAATARKYIRAGVTRIGTSSGVAIVSGAKSSGGY
eukprot:TRINITY_DN2156_c0_g1_i1.p1 TRINITY_DN2156_c0_g1~~TRINITY_DN2156_c0_g1_i1.p1  ORF type:complete len:695 (+),score=228.38 TRINITY_DN2156_c0_g1_i1:78-2087(+)